MTISSPQSPDGFDSSAKPLVLAQAIDGEDEIPIAPAEGPSRDELLREMEPRPPLPAPALEVPQHFQYSLFDLMIVTVGVAAGLAGGTWMPPDIFAALLGMVTLLGLLVVHFWPPESHVGKLVWSTLVLSYIVAVFAAILKPAFVR